MKLKSQDHAPDFSIEDFSGNTIKLSSLKGKKVYLMLDRFSGCPICNFHFHNIQKQADLFRSKGLEIIVVQESPKEVMKTFLEGEQFYATMIPDPKGSLHKLYGAEKSWSKVFTGMFHGLFSKINSGQKLFKHKIKPDGPVNRIGSDYLIDENGVIIEAYYGKFVGDRISLDTIIKFVS